MNRTLAAKRDDAANVNRALALALRSPKAAKAVLQRSVTSAASRFGKRGNPVPLTRSGKPNT